MPVLWPSSGPSPTAASEPAEGSFGGVLEDEEMASVLQAFEDRETIEKVQTAKQHGMLVVNCAASKRRLAGAPES